MDSIRKNNQKAVEQFTSKRDDYILRSLSKIKHKPWELYVVSRIVHLLSDKDSDIEFACQQYVNGGNNYYFVDLCFPSLGLFVEVYEGFHSKNEESDLKRDDEIVNATDFANPIIIRVYDKIAYQNSDEQNSIIKYRSLADINAEIDNVIINIREKKLSMINRGEFEEWDLEKKYSPKHQILDEKKGSLDASSHVGLFYQKHAMRFFGYTKGDYRRGTWSIKDSNGHSTSEYLWFPKFFKERNGWKNTLSNDFTRIEMERTVTTLSNSAEKEKQDHDTSECPIVFGHFKNPLGITVYKFLGKFERCPHESDTSLDKKGSKAVYKLIEGGDKITQMDLATYRYDYFSRIKEFKSEEDWKKAWEDALNTDDEKIKQ